MSHDKEIRASGNGFTRADFDLLRGMTTKNGSIAPTGKPADELWNRARRLVEQLGASVFGENGFHAAVWPDTESEGRGPFLWARLKRTGSEHFAAHIGVFLSPAFCNLALDLEKDPLDAGESGETLAQVLDFYRLQLAPLTAEMGRHDLVVWTDTKNVVPASAFSAVDFDAFMAANRDAGHPWPKVGCLLSADDVVGFGDRWVSEMRDRAVAILPVHDAMMASFRG